jgi:carbonic anhydrase
MAEPALTPHEALTRLADGNARFVSGLALHLNQDSGRRIQVAREQHPIAAVLCCSDSRVPPEIIFDQGIGDLFVVRTAGGVADDLALGSLEYAVDRLGVRLIVALGHQSCMAVAEALRLPSAAGHIDRLVKLIRPAVEKVLNKPGEALENAVRANTELVVELLKNSQPLLSRFIKEKRLHVSGAHYELLSGKVTFFS